jgi:hypothetical protein
MQEIQHFAGLLPGFHQCNYSCLDGYLLGSCCDTETSRVITRAKQNAVSIEQRKTCFVNAGRVVTSLQE